MANEDQVTEIEVLQSIYDGDPCFNMINDSTFQYKVSGYEQSTTKLENITLCFTMLSA